MNIATWLIRTATQDPTRDAFFDGTTCVASYGDFSIAAHAVAGWLRDQGIGTGARVAIFMENQPEYLTVQYAIWIAGGVVVPINAKLHGREAAWIVENAQTGICFARGDKAAGLRNAGVTCPIVDVAGDDFVACLSHAPIPALVDRAPDDLAWLFYTSGTTGQPKGVMITHRMLVAMSLSYFADADEVRTEDAAFYAAPLSHGAGIYNMMHVLRGARHVFPNSRGFDPAEIFVLAEHFGSAHMFAAPTMVKRLTAAGKASGATGKGLRTIVYAGGPMYRADIIEAVDHFGDIFVQIYGQGECPMSITALSRHDVSDRNHPDWRARLGSVGRAQSVCDVRIGDATGAVLAVGEVGEIMVRGDTVMPGYWQNPAASAATLKAGWLMTGDVGHMDAAGYVTMVDRSKDMIISGGSNIYPREVEEVLLTHPSVDEVSVIGRPDPEWGEVVVAFVVASPDMSLKHEELDALCLSQIARFKRPKRYIELSSLPKNNYGKVLKTVLREQLE